MACVLVVEDNQDNMDLVREILEDAGHEVLGTESAENGIEILKRGLHVDLILMDISLPSLDGYEATKIIKKDPKFGKIPVIMLTAHAQKEDREKGFKAGCQDFFTKPILDEDEFLRAIDKLLEQDNNGN